MGQETHGENGRKEGLSQTTLTEKCFLPKLITRMDFRRGLPVTFSELRGPQASGGLDFTRWDEAVPVAAEGGLVLVWCPVVRFWLLSRPFPWANCPGLELCVSAVLPVPSLYNSLAS